MFNAYSDSMIAASSVAFLLKFIDTKNKTLFFLTGPALVMILLPTEAVPQKQTCS